MCSLKLLNSQVWAFNKLTNIGSVKFYNMLHVLIESGCFSSPFQFMNTIPFILRHNVIGNLPIIKRFTCWLYLNLRVRKTLLMILSSDVWFYFYRMTYEMDESLLVGEASKSERAPRAFGVENKSMRGKVNSGQKWPQELKRSIQTTFFLKTYPNSGSKTSFMVRVTGLNKEGY